MVYHSRKGAALYGEEARLKSTVVKLLLALRPKINPKIRDCSELVFITNIMLCRHC